MSLSPDQLAMRRDGVTATDIGCIVRANPFRGPIDVWLEKVGQAPPFDETIRSKWGHLIEPVVRNDYAEVHNVRVEVPGTLAHRDHPWRMATPDGIVYPYGSNEPTHGMEIKVHGRDAMWFGGLVYGNPGTDEVPAHELIQSMWNADIADLPRWDLVPFLDGAPIEFVIDRDDELIGMLVEAGEKFLVDHVRTGAPPPPDGSEAWDALLKRKWKENSLDMINVENEADALAMISDLRAARDEVARGETTVEKIVQQLKVKIGDKAGLTWKDPSYKKHDNIYWKRNKPSRTTDWIGVMADMRQTAALVVSGKSKDFDRALAVLGAFNPHDSIGSSARAAMTAGELIELVTLARTALDDIRRASTEAARTTVTDGNRPFLCPVRWGKERRKQDNA